MSLTSPTPPPHRSWWSLPWSSLPWLSLCTVVAAALGAGCGSNDGQGVDVPALEIRTSTTGTELDPDGYQVSVDGGAPQRLGLVDSLIVDPLPPGAHTVALSGLADNCSVSGGPEVSVDVETGKTATVNYAIVCGPTHGSIVVITATTGASQDPDGYQVQLDDTGEGPIGLNDSLTIQGVPSGDRQLTLTGVAANCRVDGDNPRQIAMAPGAVDTASFTVRCRRPVGQIEVQVVSSGSPPDPDGYTVSLDSAAGVPIGVVDTIELSDVPVGSREVTLGGLAANCRVQSANPIQVDVTLGATATAAFAVSCLGSQSIAFTANAPGLLAAFIVSPDGSGLTNLTPDTLLERNPEWSPDGRRLLVVRVDPSFLSEALYVMNADGSGRTELVSGASVVDYRWSPDGTRIAFSLGRPVGSRLVSDLWVMRADGSGKMRLSSNSEEPTWSPDGRQLAYVRDDATPQVRIRDASDGSGDRRLTPDTLGAIQPAWSPDGSLIAFVSIDPNQLWVIHADGSQPRNLTNGIAQEDGPVWSPDGARIAFNSGPVDQPLESEVAVINPDGTGRANLTNHPGFDLSPDWSPDGRRLVFVRTDNGDNEIYVMNSDGSNPTDISHRPNSFESAPDWAGSVSVPNAGVVAGVSTTVTRMLRWRKGQD